MSDDERAALDAYKALRDPARDQGIAFTNASSIIHIRAFEEGMLIEDDGLAFFRASDMRQYSGKAVFWYKEGTLYHANTLAEKMAPEDMEPAPDAVLSQVASR
jgi:hypothetical protein